jgi:ribosomal-protein-alanine N-acetyltransferase
VQLETERLLLREFERNDWSVVLAYQRDPRYLRYYEWTERTPEDAQAFVQMFLDQQAGEPRTKFQLAVTLRESGELIGNCGVRLPSPDAHEGDIGYELAPIHWGCGYATEAAHAIVEFGFNQLNLHRISAECVADNAGSINVLRKLGMRQEGRLREHQSFKGRWWDTLLFAVLRHEWFE